MWLFRKRNPIKSSPVPEPAIPLQGYDVIRDHVSGLAAIRFSVPLCAWNELEESEEWEAFQALFEKAQERCNQKQR